MKLYHGTDNRSIEQFSLKYCRDNLDFGKGVYFTRNFNQALEWSCKKNGEGAVYECDIDLSHLKIMNSSFEENFWPAVCLCRTASEDIARDIIDGFEEADIVEGLMLDGRIPEFGNLANKYIAGDISADEFYNKAKKFDNSKNQYCFKTEESINKKNESLVKVYYTRKDKEKCYEWWEKEANEL